MKKTIWLLIALAAIILAVQQPTRHPLYGTVPGREMGQVMARLWDTQVFTEVEIPQGGLHAEDCQLILGNHEYITRFSPEPEWLTAYVVHIDGGLYRFSRYADGIDTAIPYYELPPMEPVPVQIQVDLALNVCIEE